MTTRIVRVAFLGFGTVNRALYSLLERRRADIAGEYEIRLIVTGIASRRTGWQADDAGLRAEHPAGVACDDIEAWLAASRADVVFEAIPLDPRAGQPALDFLRACIRHGANAISANKGPVVHGYRELTEFAAAHDVSYRFESAVMDGAPVFSLVRQCLPLAGLRAIRGIFTSTATVVIEAIEQGSTLAEGIAEAQRLGIAEADPRYDVDGWDSAMKLCALGNVLFGAELRPDDVERVGIGALSDDDVRRARADGAPIRLVGEVGRSDAGVVTARVAPMRCSAAGPLGVVHGATLVTHFDAAVFPGGLTVTSRDPDPTTTAYGMLADLAGILREHGIRSAS